MVFRIACSKNDSGVIYVLCLYDNAVNTFCIISPLFLLSGPKKRLNTTG